MNASETIDSTLRVFVRVVEQESGRDHRNENRFDLLAVPPLYVPLNVGTIPSVQTKIVVAVKLRFDATTNHFFESQIFHVVEKPVGFRHAGGRPVRSTAGPRGVAGGSAAWLETHWITHRRRATGAIEVGLTGFAHERINTEECTNARIVIAGVCQDFCVTGVI